MRALRPDTLALTLTLAGLTSLGPLSTDMYLPSLPAIAEEFGTGASRVQLTLSAVLVGFAVGQIAYGPVADRVGRRPALFAGFALYLLGTLGCALAGSVEALTLARFVQALGACGPIVLARAIVRDLYEGPRAGAELARMASLMGLVPAVAPVLGGVMHAVFGWRSVFVVALAFGAALLAVVAAALPETARGRSAAPLSPGSVLRALAAPGRNPAFRAYAGLSALSYAGLFAFISASSFVLQGVYGLSELAFGLTFGGCVVGFVGGTTLAARLAPRLGLDRTIGLGVAALAAGAGLMLAGVTLGPPSFLVVALPTALYMAGIGLVLPQSAAGAMGPFPLTAGAASSLLGVVQMGFAALIGAGVGWALRWGAWPLPAAMTLTGGGALLLFLATRRARARPA